MISLRVLCLAILTAGAVAPGTASAHAFAGVSQAIVDFRITPANPIAVFSALRLGVTAGLPVSAVTGQGIAAGGCAPARSGIDCTLSGTVSADAGQYSALSSTLSGDFVVTNISSAPLSIVNWSLDFSAFNPGGSPIGASVTNSAREYAAFSSSAATDAHACDTRAPTARTLIPTQAPGIACGVLGPNDEEVFKFTAPLNAGQTIDIPFSITISAVAASGVPEPMSAALLMGPLLAGVARRRR